MQNVAAKLFTETNSTSSNSFPLWKCFWFHLHEHFSWGHECTFEVNLLVACSRSASAPVRVPPHCTPAGFGGTGLGWAHQESSWRAPWAAQGTVLLQTRATALQNTRDAAAVSGPGCFSLRVPWECEGPDAPWCCGIGGNVKSQQSGFCVRMCHAVTPTTVYGKSV